MIVCLTSIYCFSSLLKENHVPSCKDKQNEISFLEEIIKFSLFGFWNNVAASDHASMKKTTYLKIDFLYSINA